MTTAVAIDSPITLLISRICSGGSAQGRHQSCRRRGQVQEEGVVVVGDLVFEVAQEVGV